MEKSSLHTHLISALHTFLATFGTVVLGLVIELINGNSIQMTKAFWLAFLVSAASAGVRAGIKAAFQEWGPEALGGVKK